MTLLSGSLAEKQVILNIRSLLLLGVLLSKISQGQTCTQTPFPKFIGGTTGDTYFFSIDYNSATSQLVAGGNTYDSGISSGHASYSTYTIPIIVRYQGTSLAYTWGVYVQTSTYDGVLSISISTDGSVVLA